MAGTNTRLLNLTDPANEPIANCAHIIVNVLSTSLTAAAPFSCASCKPGFSPTYNPGDEITACTAVQDAVPNTCSTSSDVMNGCETCLYPYDLPTNVIQTDTCESVDPQYVTTDNCFAGDVTGGNLTCYVCKPGYELINDACVALSVPGCSKVNYHDHFNINHSALGDRFL